MFLILLIAVILVTGCKMTKEKTAEEILMNSEAEDEIYTAILNDSTYFLKFINRIAMDEQSKKIMARNSSLVKMMCMSEKMDSLMSSDKQVMESIENRFIKRMKADSFVCDHTCTRMMEIDYVKKYFKERGIEK